MALLLHLSDLHLVSGPGDVLGDDKAKILQAGQLPSRQKRMRDSLGELGNALRAGGRELDSIVITGDITSHGSEEGFRILPDILAGLGDSLPPADRILVVPGNHDVLRGAPAGSPERYELFLKVRASGYRTAYLEGVDIDVNGALRPGAGMPPIISAGDGSFVLVGLNSANNCWVPDNRYAALAGQADIVRKTKPGAAVKELLSLIDAGGSADVARVDQAQLTAATRLLRDTESTGKGAPLRIVALHHQIAPVSSAEEVKAFESITNLGSFRQWLAGSSIGVVLHGHKHQSAALVESFTPTQADDEQPHVLLVLSAPSIQQPGNGADFGRLLDIPPVSLGVGGIHITDVPAHDAGVGYAFGKMRRRYLALDRSAESGLIAGKTAAEVYRRVLAQRDRLRTLPSPFVCRIEDGPSALVVPDSYPDIPERREPQEWFDTTVEWWQRRPRGHAAKFNHGERLFHTDADDKDRLDRIVEEFRNKTRTSRAIALLVDGRRDLDHRGEDYPAFISVQFVIEAARLNLVAYYRKQEMPHWWPINVGELAELQGKVVHRLSAAQIVVEPGSITTVTAMPVNGVGIPRVAVPWIDRMADSDERLLPLVLPLLATSAPASRAGTAMLWKSVMSDWVPGATEPTDGDPVPLLGLKRLAVVLESAADIGKDHRPSIKSLSDLLVNLSDANQVYLQDRKKLGARKSWMKKVSRASSAIDATVAALLTND
ncbi:hypothetical protein GCM10027052_25730 [Parafrigoribacterium mesophilum]|uniref:metallophosphoesterase n=1 Tax=Parafrigoribacterium mesophilum TaxID=433646 RepID=UPI0031FD8F82